MLPFLNMPILCFLVKTQQNSVESFIIIVPYHSWEVCPVHNTLNMVIPSNCVNKHFELILVRIFEEDTSRKVAVTQYFVFEQRMTMCLRLSCPLPVIGQLELM